MNSLPSITGQDALELEKFVRLRYFAELSRSLRDFLSYIESSKEVGVLVVFGEVGLGKTSLFNKLVEEASSRGHLAVRANAFDFFRAFFEKLKSSKTVAEAVADALAEVLLTALELDSEGLKSAEEKLKRLVKESKTGKVIAMLDEFEDVASLSREETVAVLKGIASLVNGEFAPLSVTGKLAGSLHLVLSMTPAAASRLASYSEFDDVMGRGRRREAFKIYLRRLTRGETVLLCLGHIRKVSEGMLPDEPPVDPVFFDAVYRASRGIPGYVVLAMNKLVSASRALGGHLKPLEVVSVLSDIEVLEHGVPFRSVEMDSVEGLIKALESELSDSGRAVLEVLIAAPGPVTIRDISRVSGLGEQEVESGINELNSALQMAFGASLLRFGVVEMKELLGSGLSPDEMLRLYDSLSMYRIEGGILTVKIAVPISDSAVREVAEDVGILEEKLASLITYEPQTIAFKLPRAILDSIYPPPCPICCAAKDRTLAAEIWRESLKEVMVAEADREELGKACLSLLIEDFLRVEREISERGGYRKVVDFGGKPYRVLLKPIAILREEDVSLITKAADEGFPLVIAFTKEGLEELALLRAMDVRGSHAEVIKLSSVDMAILLGLYRLRGELLHHRAEELIASIREKAGINPREFFERALSRMTSKGLILTRPPWDTKIPLSDLPKIYDFYLAYPGRLMTSEEAFKWTSDRIRGARPFGLKVKGAVAGRDIESSQRLEALEPRLVELGFLERIGNRVAVSNSPIEARLLLLLKEPRRIRELLKVFVYSDDTEAEELLEKVYLDCLWRKGYIEMRHGAVVPIELSKLMRGAEERLRAVKEEYEKSEAGKFDAILFRKLRSERLIRVKDLISTIEELISSAKMMEREVDIRRLMQTARRLESLFVRTYLTLIRWAEEEARELLRRAEIKVEDLKNVILKLRSSAKQAGIEILPEPSELKKAREILEELRALINSEPSEEMLQGVELPSDVFSFPTRFEELRKKEVVRGKLYYNPKLYVVKRKFNELTTFIEDVVKAAEDAEELIEAHKKLLVSKTKVEETVRILSGRDVRVRILGFSGNTFESILELSKWLKGLGRSLKGASETFSKFAKLLDFLTRNFEDIKRLLREADSLRKEVEAKNLEPELAEIPGIKAIFSAIEAIRGVPEELSLRDVESLASLLSGIPEAVSEARASIDRAKKTIRARVEKVQRIILEVERKIKEAGVEDAELQSALEDIRKKILKREKLIDAEREALFLQTEFSRKYGHLLDPVIRLMLRKLSEASEQISLLKLVKEIASELHMDEEEVAKKLALRLLRMQEDGEVIVFVKKLRK